MGTYHLVVCHKCKESYTPTLLKESEIVGNESVAAEVGRFFVDHHHIGYGPTVELIADQYGQSWDDVADYRKVKLEDS